MVPSDRNNVTAFRPDNSQTAGGGSVRDSSGRWWKIVDHCSCTATTGGQCGTLKSDGHGNEWIEP